MNYNNKDFLTDQQKAGERVLMLSEKNDNSHLPNVPKDLTNKRGRSAAGNKLKELQ